MSAHHKINYIEIPVTDISRSKAFFKKAFGWGFVDYGPDYAAITDAGIDGGFYLSENSASTANGSVLVVLYTDDLAKSEKAVLDNGGHIVKPLFSFPGGRRFHFSDPSHNEYAIWSDK